MAKSSCQNKEMKNSVVEFQLINGKKDRSHRVGNSTSKQPN